MRILTLLLLGVIAWPWAYAEQPVSRYDSVSLSVSRERSVANDILVVELYAQHDGADAAEVSSRVNSDMGWAIDQAKKVPGVVIQTAGYISQPVYRDQHLVGWRARQSVRLESEDAGSLGELVGDLQSKLRIASMSYRISSRQRAQVEDDLIGEAIVAFGDRARLIADSLKRTGYRLIEMDVITDRAPTPRMRSMATTADSAVMSAPSIEPGEQVVRVMVNGTIEVLN